MFKLKIQVFKRKLSRFYSFLTPFFLFSNLSLTLFSQIHTRQTFLLLMSSVMALCTLPHDKQEHSLGFPGIDEQPILASNSMRSSHPKSIQSCPTLCDPIDGSPPGSPFPRILQLLLLLLSRFSRVRLCATPQTVAHQASPSLGFSRQEHEWVAIFFSSA